MSSSPSFSWYLSAIFWKQIKQIQSTRSTNLAQPHTTLKPPSKSTIQNGTPEIRYRTIQQLDVRFLKEQTLRPFSRDRRAKWDSASRRSNASRSSCFLAANCQKTGRLLKHSNVPSGQSQQIENYREVLELESKYAESWRITAVSVLQIAPQPYSFIPYTPVC